MTKRDEQLRARVRQLILMRETGPKRSAWHAARMRLIWRLHDEIRQEALREQQSPSTQPFEEPGSDA